MIYVESSKVVTYNETEHKMYIDNAKDLIKTLGNNNDEDLTIKAELYRNIGSFENAERTILNINDNKFHAEKILLLKEIHNRNSEVITLIQPSPKRQF